MYNPDAYGLKGEHDELFVKGGTVPRPRLLKGVKPMANQDTDDRPATQTLDLSSLNDEEREVLTWSREKTAGRISESERRFLVQGFGRQTHVYRYDHNRKW